LNVHTIAESMLIISAKKKKIERVYE